MQNLRRDCSAGLPVLRTARSPLSNLPIWAWISLCYLHQHHRPRNQDARSFAAPQLSLHDSLARRVLRSALYAREVYLSLRSFDRPHDPSVHRRLEAVQSVRQGVRRHELPVAPAYMSFYARYFVWSGDFAWGDRYVSTAVELASLLAVPLL